jgi:hypothetical protein
MNTDLTDVAWDLYDKGINAFPLSYRAKRPPSGFRWKPLTERRVTEDEIRAWFCTDVKTNIALLCGRISGVMAIDADSKNSARQLFGVLPRTPAMQRTPNGGHFLYRLPEGAELFPAVKTTIKGIECDVRGEASYIACAPSVHPSGKPYAWVCWPWNLRDVPEFNPAWLTGNGKASRLVTRGTIRSVDAYLPKIESVQGNNGSAGLVRAAAICRDAGLTQAEAMAKLVVWNSGPTVKPAWTPEELARAVTRTYAT